MCVCVCVPQRHTLPESGYQVHAVGSVSLVSRLRQEDLKDNILLQQHGQYATLLQREIRKNSAQALQSPPRGEGYCSDVALS